MDTVMKAGSRKGRLNYALSFKLDVALAACEPGVSVSKVALAHRLNANMVFKWRREYRAGLFNGPGLGPGALLPVVVVAEQSQAPSASVVNPPAPKPTRSLIEIVIADAIVRIEGAVDAVALRKVIESLRA